MAKIKYDVTDAEAGGSPQPKPGVYPAKIKKIDGPKDSKQGNPMIEVVLTIPKGKFETPNGKSKAEATLSQYIVLDGSMDFRMRELTDALGLKPKGALDSDKVAGESVRVRVKADEYDGEYRARVGRILASEDDDEGEEPDDEEETEDDDEDAEDESADDDDEEGDDEDEDWTEDELEDLSNKDLKEVAEEFEVEDIPAKLTAKSKPKLIAAILEAQGGEEGEDDDEDDDEETPDYSEMSMADLKKLLKERGLKTTGKQKALVARLEKDDATDDDGEPF